LHTSTRCVPPPLNAASKYVFRYHVGGLRRLGGRLGHRDRLPGQRDRALLLIEQAVRVDRGRERLAVLDEHQRHIERAHPAAAVHAEAAEPERRAADVKHVRAVGELHPIAAGGVPGQQPHALPRQAALGLGAGVERAQRLADRDHPPAG
jgi:hypothetical protein